MLANLGCKNKRKSAEFGQFSNILDVIILSMVEKSRYKNTLTLPNTDNIDHPKELYPFQKKFL
ncbi:hypothetical protein HZS_4363 [Henneguya salminicola]|nr:hypothetical protein HZS_4363 [Henneguya salminicola]